MIYDGLVLSPNERRIELIEGVLRVPTFGYPFVLSLKFENSLFLGGLLILFLGFVLYLITWHAIFTTPLEEPVTKNIFKFSRHPGRITPQIIFIGIGFCTTSLFFLIISGLFIIFHCLNGLAEERGERLKHGVKYETYAHNTPRWIGFPKR
jgi:protein-S-isoprenylcysteine O-methyltransferase Ste14